jgi:hypothetical protein
MPHCRVAWKGAVALVATSLLAGEAVGKRELESRAAVRRRGRSGGRMPASPGVRSRRLSGGCGA